MRNFAGEKVMVTPSVLYGTDSAIAAIDGGEGGWIHVRMDGYVPADPRGYKTSYVVKIYDTNGDLIHSDDDQRGPYSEGMSLTDILPALRATVSFLLACAESKSEDSDNFFLYPTAAREWAELYSDELSIISMEIDQEIASDES